MMNVAKRISLKSVLTKLPKFELPQRLRGGAIEKSATYLHNIYLDYKAVFMETRQDIRNRPLRSTIIGGILVGLGYLMRHNPSEDDFLMQLVQCNNKLLRVQESSRNPTSYQHIEQLATLNDQKILRHQSLGFFSVIYRADFSRENDLYMAQCKFLRPSLKSYFTERIVDVGILDEFQLMKNKMIDYDVSPEWNISTPVLEFQ